MICHIVHICATFLHGVPANAWQDCWHMKITWSTWCKGVCWPCYRSNLFSSTSCRWLRKIWPLNALSLSWIQAWFLDFTINKDSLTLESEIVVLKDINKCYICDFKATSKAGLKSHITKKHKDVSQPAPEKERDQNLSNSLDTSLPHVEREEPVTDLFLEVVKGKSIQCEWVFCSHVANSTNDMMEHISATHTITFSFVFPDSSKTLECEDCGIEFFMDHGYAMHSYTDHRLSFNCDHCLVILPEDEQEFMKIHMELSTAPCNGDSNCGCTLRWKGMFV